MADGPTPILDTHVNEPPTVQGTLDIFHGGWASAMPGSLGEVQAGQSPLFEDPRITQTIAAVGGVDGKRVLELGPLEAAHTTMLEQAGAASVLAIEGNTKSYLKCLVVKELLGLQRSRFLCGDFVSWMEDNPEEHFDLVVACGVLYHMQDPVRVIELAAGAGDHLYIWTHYYDASSFSEEVAAMFSEAVPVERGERTYTYNKHQYRDDRAADHFWGSGHHYSVWLSHDDLLAAVRSTGLEVVDTTLHTDGVPSIEILASRP
ncbi:class I SAM-dependent methyltransferase [Euzebya tangerina]|uniref:class I SAM-dependent methyltransferase n=1 Tax=Euzebya tangerina TaxID=591198 RepID=UPI000E31726D|nr:class I SAM-dependent methyltransferase [Euzebya tangerina]